ncbi:UDP-2,4-diacetamido-2,4,6-trideoxy-beta-L-altropyranose hydrolase [Chryseolinea soli]|nr:UDP-2,4-diacetamido-2,4,6-trideoxy-beta-L-altropyranose hydrolase [Chryseolinea soli]
MKTRVYLRADGNAKMGLGHIHRSLALAEMLRDDFECHFVIHTPLPGLRELILKSCASIIDLGDLSQEEELKYLLDLFRPEDVIVLDGYAFKTEYQQRLKNKGHVLVCIDDLQSYHFVADVVINPAGGVDLFRYSGEAYTKFLCGPTYALLKPPYLEAARKRGARTGKPSLLICMGGADPDNHTLATLKENVGQGFDTVYVIIGEAYVHKKELYESVNAFQQKIEVLNNLDPRAMAAIMKECAVAICSASGVAYEYASVGGELYIKQTATNQTLLYRYLIDAGLAFPVGEFRADEARVKAADQQQSRVFDGHSGSRILKVFNRLDFGLNAALRKATGDDLLKVFEWANDPELRRQSFSTQAVSLENHTKWFTGKLADPATELYIVEYKHLPVAQVRFDVKLEATIISYSIDARYRGRGWGQPVLQLALDAFQKTHRGTKNIVGYVKMNNIGSTKVFQNLGFAQRETNDYPESYKFELNAS